MENLSKNIVCDESVMRMMEPDTVHLANVVVVQAMSLEDPGLFIQIVDPDNLHRALALPDAPVPQGVDVTASLDAYRAWLIHQARNVKGSNSQVSANSDTSLAFHQLTPSDGLAIQSEWYCRDWNYHLRRNRNGPEEERIGQFANVIWMWGTGPYHATITLDKIVFE